MTKQKFVENVRNHKKEIAIGVLGLVGTGLMMALGVKVSKSIKVSNNPVDLIGEIVSDSDWTERNLVEGFTTGKVNDLWNEDGYGNAIVQKLIGGIADDTEVSAVLSFINTKVEI